MAKASQVVTLSEESIEALASAIAGKVVQRLTAKQLGPRSTRRPRTPKPEEAGLLTAEDVAKKLRIGMTNVYKLLNTGALKSISVTDRGFRISSQQLEEFVKSRTRPAIT